MDIIKQQINNLVNDYKTIIIFKNVNIRDNLSQYIIDIRQLYNINNNFFVIVIDNTVIFGCNYTLTDIDILLNNEYTYTNKEIIENGHIIFSVDGKKLGK